MGGDTLFLFEVSGWLVDSILSMFFSGECPQLVESGIRSNWDTLNHGICDSSEGKSVMYKQFAWLLWESPTSYTFFLIMRLMYIYTYNIKRRTILQSYTHILCYVYYIHIANRYDIPFSFSNSMSPTCPLVYIHRQHTIQYIYTYANISEFLWTYKSNMYPCIHTLIISIHLSIFSFFFATALPSPWNFTSTIGSQAGGRSGHWAGFDRFKRWAVGDIGLATAGWWMVRL